MNATLASLAERSVLSLANAQRPRWFRKLFVGLAFHLLLDLANDPLGLVLMPMDE